MPARDKLNAAYFQGSLLIAALIGVLANSWIVFIFALCFLLAGNVLANQIRFQNK